MGCPPLKSFFSWMHGPRISCSHGKLVLGPRVPLGQLPHVPPPGQSVLGPCAPLSTTCPPVSQRLQNTYIILCGHSVDRPGDDDRSGEDAAVPEESHFTPKQIELFQCTKMDDLYPDTDYMAWLIWIIILRM